MTRLSRAAYWPAGVLALALLVALSVSLGSVAVPWDRALAAVAHGLGLAAAGPDDAKWDAIVFLLRLPRVLGAALIGGALALAGAVMQGIMRNPMADPAIIGISGGASLGAVAAIATGLAAAAGPWLPVCACLGSLGAAALIFGIGLGAGRQALQSLILAGMAVSTFLGACTSLVLSTVNHDNMAQFIFWAMGNLYNLRWETLAAIAAPMLAGMAALPLFAREINIMQLGEEEARAVGLETGRVRLLLLGMAAVVTALGVSVSGPIAFVGLVVPHIVRMLVGADHRALLPASVLGGAVFLVGCDLVARLALGGQEMQVGIVTSLLGAPYFVALLLRTWRRDRAA